MSKLFESLNQTETGSALIEYLEKKKAEVGYLPDSIEGARMACAVLDEIIDKIKLVNPKSKSGQEDFT